MGPASVVVVWMIVMRAAATVKEIMIWDVNSIQVESIERSEIMAGGVVLKWRRGIAVDGGKDHQSQRQYGLNRNKRNHLLESSRLGEGRWGMYRGMPSLGK